MDLPRSDPDARPPADWAPIDACTLPTSEQPLRVAEFDALFATSLRAVEHPHRARRARLVLVGDQTLHSRIRRLADAETACCSFFTFTVTTLDPDRTGETVVALDIEVPAARSEVLAALIEQADQARRATA